MLARSSSTLNSSGISCIHCGKCYKTRIRLDKHSILCQINSAAKLRYKYTGIDEDEDLVLPSQKEMYKILLDLTLKCNKMEEKLEVMSKWVDKKKKKINVVEWLNSNVHPDITFDLLVDSIKVSTAEIDFFITNKHFLDCLNEIFNKYFYNKSCSPLFAFTQKVNHIYVYEKNAEGVISWNELTRDKCIYFLNIIHYKFIRAMYDWKKLNQDKINTCDRFIVKYGEANIKLMDVNFKNENTLGRIRASLYNNIKTDLKALIEYEFEF
jgi:hypothetical protein